ncbi:cytochrome P450 [Streptantibioticus ferralitis]|uniref:Cytochrome P450 n=1 Tax=Streptantibioticus ferralitis TaxID=236510 RepID=A0ABT5YYJ6_9ACTN|nr:cytochrome P450 [Streptantibioticus ferralitis]MDF2256524.1 cytochrome P450 [Streptantibioticus ferralitis]
MTKPDQAMTYPFPDGRQLEVPTEFAELRAKCPVQRVALPYGGEGWLVTRQTEVRTVLGDPRFSRAATVQADIPRTKEWLNPGGDILSLDPPEHSRLRRLVSGAFSRRNVELWRPRIEELAGELVAGMRAAGPHVDLVESFSMPLPITVICEMLGVPAADRHLFERFSELLFSGTGVAAEEVRQAAVSLTAYLTEHVARHRAKPQDDLLSQLIAARDEDEGRLTEEELVSLGVTILAAGHETTANAIANFVYTLLTEGIWSGLVERPERLDTAVEELLRHVPLGGSESLPRIATEDVELGDTTVRKGEAVFPAMVSANFDGAVFTNPQLLDLDRSHNPHLAFGYGPHFCLGAQLARTEIRTALGTLLREFPELHLGVRQADIVWREETALIRGPRRLPVAW